MDTHGRRSNRRSQGKLDPDTMEELRQLAELAKSDPAIMDHLERDREEHPGLRVVSIESDEIELYKEPE